LQIDPIREAKGSDQDDVFRKSLIMSVHFRRTGSVPALDGATATFNGPKLGHDSLIIEANVGVINPLTRENDNGRGFGRLPDGDSEGRHDLAD
jgi:hypothetical protein